MRHLALSIVIAACLAGCAGIEPVAPWQKGQLAKPEMGFADEVAGAAYAEHVYSSREAVSGGTRVGGGGCGCN